VTASENGRKAERQPVAGRRGRYVNNKASDRKDQTQFFK
jgi:hypothetical protein